MMTQSLKVYQESAAYWRDRAVASERRVTQLEALLETPENQRDADLLIEASDECYRIDIAREATNRLYESLVRESRGTMLYYATGANESPTAKYSVPVEEAIVHAEECFRLYESLQWAARVLRMPHLNSVCRPLDDEPAVPLY